MLINCFICFSLCLVSFYFIFCLDAFAIRFIFCSFFVFSQNDVIESRKQHMNEFVAGIYRVIIILQPLAGTEMCRMNACVYVCLYYYSYSQWFYSWRAKIMLQNRIKRIKKTVVYFLTLFIFFHTTCNTCFSRYRCESWQKLILKTKIIIVQSFLCIIFWYAHKVQVMINNPKPFGKWHWSKPQVI